VLIIWRISYGASSRSPKNIDRAYLIKVCCFLVSNFSLRILNRCSSTIVFLIWSSTASSSSSLFLSFLSLMNVYLVKSLTRYCIFLLLSLYSASVVLESTQLLKVWVWSYLMAPSSNFSFSLMPSVIILNYLSKTKINKSFYFSILAMIIDCSG